MERRNGLSLATQPISVKGGTGLLAIPCVNSHPLSRVRLNLCTEPHPLGVFGCRVLLAGPCQLSCLILATWPPGTSSWDSPALRFLLPGEMLVPDSVARTVESTSTPFQTQLT